MITSNIKPVLEETAERRRAVPRALRFAGPLDLAAVRAAIEASGGREHV